MTRSQSHSETQKRMRIIKQIDNYVSKSNLSGLLVTGSLAWGKDYAVTDASDVDFYLLAPSLGSFQSSINKIPSIPQKTIATFQEMLDYKQNSIDTRSMKTDIGPYYGAVYLFTEKEFMRLSGQFDASRSKFFKNLRPSDKPQTKEYKSFDGNKLTFTTSILEASKNTKFWIRTDPLFLIESKRFYGSIFLSHLLFSEAYTDKHNIIHSAQTRAKHFLKSLLPKQEKRALVSFQNYLPRIEKMNNKTINDLFKSVWRA